MAAADTLALLDWKRRVFGLYAAVRAMPPEPAWELWRKTRDERLVLEVDWLEGYGSGAFLSFRDATSGRETYGGGRYVLDTVKGADLGEEDGKLVLDFNFAYNPSCSYDPSWVCPLAPPAN